MKKEEADDAFEALSDVLTRVRQAYRHLRDTGQAAAASAVRSRMRRMERQMDELLALRYERWMGDAKRLLPQLRRMAREARVAAQAVQTSARNARSLGRILKILDDVISLAGQITVFSGQF